MQDISEWNVERPEMAPLRFLFYLLDTGFRQEVISEALDARSAVSPDLRAELGRAINNSASVPGFRNAALAPAPRLVPVLDGAVQNSTELALAVARVWFESQEDLREAVTAELLDKDALPNDQPLPAESVSVGCPSSRVSAAFRSYCESNPDESSARTTFMFQLITGLTDVDAQEGLDAEESVPDLLSATLETLAALSPVHSEWEYSIPAFASDLADLLRQKQEQREVLMPLSDLLASIMKEYAPIMDFFQWDTRTWNVDWTVLENNLTRAHEHAVELNDLLAQYAPIHDRAPVVTEEISRATRRIELLPRLLKVGNALQRIFNGEPPDGGEGNQENEADTEPVCSTVSSVQAEASGAATELDSRNQDGDMDDTEAPGNLDQETPEPACDIDDHILLLLTLQDLEQETDDLEHENAGLKAQVKALERRLYESRSQEENLRWAVAYKDNPGETEDIPELETVGAAVALARERYPGQLLFQLNAESNAEESSFKWPEQVWNALRWLATDYFTSHLGRNPIGDMDEACRSACGMWCKTSQHENTMTQFRDSYTTWVDGRRIWLGEHIGKGNSFDPRRTIRIAFDWDRQLQKVVIGYIGQHQRTSAA